jgi:hypothetical protein
LTPTVIPGLAKAFWSTGRPGIWARERRGRKVAATIMGRARIATNNLLTDWLLK